jgi:hypothetical protein
MGAAVSFKRERTLPVARGIEKLYNEKNRQEIDTLNKEGVSWPRQKRD